MPDLQSGSVVTGTDAPTAVNHVEGTLHNSITSTSYAAGSPACQVAFIAPTTGRVLIEWAAFLDNNGANTTFITPQVREGASLGSGTIVLAASDENALFHLNTNQLRAGCFYPLDGLVPGASYNVQLMHRVTGGTGTVDDREVIVTPLP